MICDKCADSGKASNMNPHAKTDNALRIHMCGSEGCGGLFDSESGYYSMLDGHTSDQNLDICPNCRTARVLLHYSPRAGTLALSV